MPNSASLGSLLFIALIVGALVPFQAGANAALAKLIGYPLWATLVSLLVSLILVVALIVVMKAPAPALATALTGPWWMWVGGAAGVAYLTAALLLTPKLGVAGFLVAVVAGQMLASLVIDHFGLMGLPEKPISMARVVGLVLIVFGMVVSQLEHWRGAM